MEEKNELVLSVFCGIRVHQGKKVYQWENIDENENTIKSFTFSKPLVPAAVGGVFETYQTETTIVTVGEQAPRYLKQYSRKEQVTDWAILDEAAKQQLALKSINTKAAKVKPLDDALNDIYEISQHLSRKERVALIAKISEVVLRI